MQNIRSELFCEKEKAIFKHENNLCYVFFTYKKINIAMVIY